MKALAALLVALFACVNAARAEPCLKYGPVRVQLSGTVTLKIFFGPPGYGEDPAHDMKETQGFLILDRPVCVDKGPESLDESESNQTEITLVPPKGVNWAHYSGTRVIVDGTLFHQHTGHHRTKLLMTVITVKKNDKKKV